MSEIIHDNEWFCLQIDAEFLMAHDHYFLNEENAYTYIKTSQEDVRSIHMSNCMD